MLSGRGLCDGLITRPEESCRLSYVVYRNLVNEEALAREGLLRQKKNIGGGGHCDYSPPGAKHPSCIAVYMDTEEWCAVVVRFA